jgi:hypothetical protein
MIKYAKFKFNKKSMIFLISRFFRRTLIHISQNTVCEALLWAFEFTNWMILPSVRLEYLTF